MPVFDAAPLLPGCLAGIRAQTMEDFELVAVDDGSQDESGRLLEEAAADDPRVVPIRAAHQGIVGALNRGLAACRGRFIARMDADDRMHPERLAAQLAYLEQHPRCDLAGCWVAPYGIGKLLTPGAIRYHDWLNSLAGDGEIKTNLFVDSPIAHSTFFARAELFRRLGGYRDCAWAEDYDFLFRAALAGATFGNVPRVLLDRGDRVDRLTRTDRRYRRRPMFEAKAHYFAKGRWLDGRRGVVVAGSGPSGRVVATALRRERVVVRCFVDNRPGPAGRTVMGIPAHGAKEPFPNALLEKYRDAFVLLCIGDKAGRNQVAERLSGLGLRPGKDFLRFI